MRSDRKTRREHNHHAAIRSVDAVAFMDGMQDTLRSSAPLVDARTARTVAGLLRHGFVSARRMASALDASFEDIDATFAHHRIPYRLFR